MARFMLVFLLLIATSQSQSPIPQQDVDNAVARAESLYFEARFRESLQQVLPLDVALRQEPSRVKDRVRIKLQMALAHIGLEENSEAMARFAEICALDSAYQLDPNQFAPKVITLFEDARTQHLTTRCATVCQEVGRILDAGATDEFLKLLDSTDTACPCLQAAAMDAAELSYQNGVEAYKEDNLTEALRNLRTALKLNPQHQVAQQYIDLTENKLRLSADRLVLEWRLLFEGREFPRAASKYHELEAANLEGVATPALDQIRSEYRKVLSTMAESWTRACSISDVLARETSRQAREMLPNPSIGEDILAGMSACPVKRCLQVSSQLAKTRLRTQVNPEIPRGAMSRSLTVRVRLRIDESGNVEVNGMDGGNAEINPAIQAALERWKFTPAIVDGRPQCVETELPIVLNP
jgi:tetratricopeptide (TPR) repeat protein